MIQSPTSALRRIAGLQIASEQTPSNGLGAVPASYRTTYRKIRGMHFDSNHRIQHIPMRLLGMLHHDRQDQRYQ